MRFGGFAKSKRQKLQERQKTTESLGYRNVYISIVFQKQKKIEHVAQKIARSVRKTERVA